MTGSFEGNSIPRTHLALRLGERKYVCDLVSVQEIVLYPNIDPIGPDPGTFIGTFDSPRGSIPVLDLLGRPFDAQSIRKKILVIAGLTAQTIGILVDELLENLGIEISAVLPLPAGAYGVNYEILQGVIDFDKETYYLINLELLASTWQDEFHPAGKGAKVSEGNGEEQIL
jgi:chemotaxis signal transduction protein